ncbi:MAG TPA: PIN domain-containing protein [Acidimicrobiia bacterium]|jgi:predicted nucleic acid-binding protein
MAIPLRYWDSDAFLGWLANEPDKVDECRGVIKAAQAGDVRLVTSSLTLTEVIKLKGRTPLPTDKEPVIKEFFKHEWIIVRQLDRFIAEYARDVVWQYGVNPKDAVHVATAIASRVPHLDTFDKRLIAKSGKIGDPPLVIGHPNIPEQLDLDELMPDQG